MHFNPKHLEQNNYKKKPCILNEGVYVPIEYDKGNVVVLFDGDVVPTTDQASYENFFKGIFTNPRLALIHI